MPLEISQVALSESNVDRQEGAERFLVEKSNGVRKDCPAVPHATAVEREYQKAIIHNEVRQAIIEMEDTLDLFGSFP
jgi:hypothetical protein